MIGRTLGHYRITEKIGAGGMGVVYRARDERLDRDVALKVLTAATLEDSAAVACFRREAHLLSRLNHPNIATIHDFDSQDGLSFLVMEYIPGVTLNQKVALDSLSQKDVIRLGVQLAQGLHAAHNEGVVHRDLKPSNLRITPDFRLKILDFGLAKLSTPTSTNATQTVTSSALVGTLPYMSPEQLQCEKADARSDIYSAGVVLYEMATRHRPFGDAQGPQLANAIINLSPLAPMERNRQVSPGLQNIILKALDKNPEQRYQSARELQVDLERLNSSVTTIASSNPPAQSQNAPLEMAHILFMDIVGYSIFPMDEQRFILRELQKSVCSGSEFTRAKSIDQLISLPTGDGMALVFFGDPEAPCRCALQVTSALKSHPEIKLRMGIHTGPIYRIPDINDSRNVAGGGINIAQRVMDSGQAGHILLSKAIADVLSQLGAWSGLLHEVGEIEVKHGAKIHVFNLYNADAGNPNPPRNVLLTKAVRKSESHRGRRATVRPAVHQPSSKPKALKPVGIADTAADHVAKQHRIWPYTVASIFLIGALAFTIPTSRKWILSFKTPATPAGIPSLLNGYYLAVLPFDVKGDSEKLHSIAEGLDEGLATKLFTLQDLSVASSQAIRKADLTQPLLTIAGHLGVNLVVKGIIEGTTTRLRITVTLDDVLGHKHLLKEQFSGGGADVLSLEDQIFTRISKVLVPEEHEVELQRGPSRPTDDNEAYDLYSQGRVAFLTHRDIRGFRTAIGFYNEALKKDPHFALACARLSDAQLAMYRETRDTQWIRNSLDTAQRAQILNEKLPEAYIAMGNLYGETGRSEEAISQFKRALQLSPKSDEGYRRLGNLYLTSGDKERAIRSFQNAVAIFPNYWLNYNELGNAYLQFGENDKALEAYNRAIQLDPDNGLGYMNKGNAYFQQSSFHESIVQYRRALELQSSADVYSNLGVAYFFLGRYSEAIQMGQKAVELHPKNEVDVGNLAASYYWAGEKAKAMETYENAIALANKDLEVNPNDASTLGDLALYTAKKGDLQRALYYMRRARSISASDFNLLSEEAQIRMSANQPTLALQSLAAAFENGYSVEQAKLDPEFGGLRGNPQFEDLIKKMATQRK